MIEPISDSLHQKNSRLREISRRAARGHRGGPKLRLS